MRAKPLILLLTLLVAAYSAFGQQPAPPTAPAAPSMTLKVGDPAPDFTMRGTDGKTYKLSEFKGQKNVVLAFYVLAFTGG
jgi:cytochrome oxidase Cu insertion factor (SCO1/SenC/PrrC family)